MIENNLFDELIVDDEQEIYEEQRRIERRKRRMEMRRRKERQRKIRRIIKVAVPCVAVLVVFLVAKIILTPKAPQPIKNEPAKVYSPGQGDLEMQRQALSPSVTNVTGDAAKKESGEVTNNDQGNAADVAQTGNEAIGTDIGPQNYAAVTTDSTASIAGEVVSSYGILINTETGEIIAQRNPKTIINPASMTKVLTVLVAAEHISQENLKDTFTITQEITDYSYKNDCSVVGFEVGEIVTVEDLFYGTVLPSGADAAVGLAEYVAGSQEAFVELMNEKLAQLGLSETAHFTNCVGLYDESHRCSVYDMAIILQAALDNEICRNALSAHTYNTSKTEQHPEGLLISNWFLRRIEDKDAGGFVLAGKTGYVVESGSCAASCALDSDENEYICVTADSTSSWRCIYDHVEIYKTFLPQKAESQATE